MGLDLVMDYFGGFGDIVDLEALSPTFIYLNKLTYFVMKLIEKQDKNQGISVLVAPYISERTAQICEENGMGYFDYAGNCWFIGHSLYLSEKGNKNQQPKEYRAVSIFERNAVVSSCILRELFADVRKVWKLKYLADNDFKDLSGEELKKAISDSIRAKQSNLVGNMASQGTTPRQLTDLIGSLVTSPAVAVTRVPPWFWCRAISTTIQRKNEKRTPRLSRGVFFYKYGSKKSFNSRKYVSRSAG